MAKCSSPPRILGRKKSFCSWLPYSMIVGPTVPMVSSGSGAPARDASSLKIICSIIVRSWPPYSFGQPTPSQPSLPIWRTVSR